MNRKLLTGNGAAAWGARLAKVDYVPAFPITPQTEIIETLAHWIDTGDLDSKPHAGLQAFSSSSRRYGRHGVPVSPPPPRHCCKNHGDAVHRRRLARALRAGERLAWTGRTYHPGTRSQRHTGGQGLWRSTTFQFGCTVHIFCLPAGRGCAGVAWADVIFRRKSSSPWRKPPARRAATGRIPPPRLLYREEELREVRKLQAIAVVERQQLGVLSGWLKLQAEIVGAQAHPTRLVQTGEIDVHGGLAINDTHMALIIYIAGKYDMLQFCSISFKALSNLAGWQVRLACAFDASNLR